MKYFAVATAEGKEIVLGGVTAARSYLRAHPDCQSVTRYWWYREDLIEVEDYTRERILTGKRTALLQGETAQWAAPRGRI